MGGGRSRRAAVAAPPNAPRLVTRRLRSTDRALSRPLSTLSRPTLARSCDLDRRTGVVRRRVDADRYPDNPRRDGRPPAGRVRPGPAPVQVAAAGRAVVARRWPRLAAAGRPGLRRDRHPGPGRRLRPLGRAVRRRRPDHGLPRARRRSTSATASTTENRVEVAADQLDEANDVVAKLDVGPRSIAEIDDWPSRVEPLGHPRRSRSSAGAGACAKLAEMIRPIDGVVSAYVTSTGPRRGAAAAGPRRPRRRSSSSRPRTTAS